MLPFAQAAVQNNFVYRKDNAPAHRVRIVVRFLETTMFTIYHNLPNLLQIWILSRTFGLKLLIEWINWHTSLPTWSKLRWMHDTLYPSTYSGPLSIVYSVVLRRCKRPLGRHTNYWTPWPFTASLTRLSTFTSILPSTIETRDVKKILCVPAIRVDLTLSSLFRSMCIPMTII